ncbi:MAG TPA: ribonuclease HII [Acidimicrobiales bacterium]|nr:ribonuclease HII [Acidimicrobiales bacterium]
MLRGGNLGTLVVVSAPIPDLLEFERALLARGEVVVGVDEVGRGALAGPLTVGAVVVRGDQRPPNGLNDSKLLSSARRASLVEPLHQWAAEWSLGSVSAAEIDDWGLRLALAVAATRALEKLKSAPTHALIDGNFNLLRCPHAVSFAVTAPPPLRYDSLPVTTLIQGDRRSACIAAAAVLAKVHRDAVMVALHEEFGEYQWAQNKGYGAPEHLEAIRRRGPNIHHRRTWHLPVPSP